MFFSPFCRLRGRSAARKQAIKLLIQNICIDFKGGVSTVLDACLITCRAQRATQWAAGDTLQFWQQPVAFHLPFLPLPAAQIQPDLPLLPPSNVPPSASHTVDSTNNRLLSKHTHAHAAQKHENREGGLLASAPTQEIRQPFACMGMCVDRTRSPIFSCFCEEARADVDKTTALAASPRSHGGSETRSHAAAC